MAAAQPNAGGTEETVGSTSTIRIGAEAASVTPVACPGVNGTDVDGTGVGSSAEPRSDSEQHDTRSTHAVDRRYDLNGSVGALRRGRGDPAYQVAPDGAIWLGCRTPANEPGTLRLVRTSPETVEAQTWGPGARWLQDSVPHLLGLHDTDESRAEFADLVETHANPALVKALRANPGFRVIRSGRVFDSLVPSVLEQRVTVAGARQSWRRLMRKYGEPAPGPDAMPANAVPAGAISAAVMPTGLLCTPPHRGWSVIPSWEWRRAEVDGKRSTAILAAARVASRLEETVGMEREEAARRVRTVPGIGVWTAAEVMHRAHGDADAVSVGDLHLPRVVCSALGGGVAAGRGADDEKMLALLEPYRGHRYRVAALLYR